MYRGTVDGSRSNERMNATPKNRRKRVGVICDTPSIQLSAQYDAIADLDEFEFHLLLRLPEHANPAWAARPPARVGFEYLEQLRVLPKRLRPFLNINVGAVLDRHDFDALIIHGIYDNAAVWQGIWWCQRRGRPYLLRCDANIKKETDAAGRRLLQRAVSSRNTRGAGALLCIGTQNCKYYSYMGAQEHQMFMAPWEIDYADLRAHLDIASPKRGELRAALGVEGRVVIGSIGRLYPLKGFQDAIAAVTRLASEELPVTLLIAGDGPYRRRLEALAANAPAGAVQLLGHLTRDRVIEMLVSSDVFALCSHVEAWGLVVNEAALAGLPLLTSDAVGACADLIVPERNGFVFPARNRDRLYGFLREMVERQDLRASMGRASREILDNWRSRFPVKEGYRQALHHALESGNAH